MEFPFNKKDNVVSEAQIMLFDRKHENNKEMFYWSDVFNTFTEKTEFDQEVDNLIWQYDVEKRGLSLPALYLALKHSPRFISGIRRTRFCVFLISDKESYSFKEVKEECEKNYKQSASINELLNDLEKFYNEYHTPQGSIFAKYIGIRNVQARVIAFVPKEVYPFMEDKMEFWDNMCVCDIKDIDNEVVTHLLINHIIH